MNMERFRCSWVVVASFCSLSLLPPNWPIQRRSRSCEVQKSLKRNHVNAYIFGPGPRWWRDLSILKQQQAPVDRKRHVSIDIQLKFNEWKIMMYSIVKCPFHDIVWFGLASWLWWKIWECWWPPSLRPILGWDGPTPRRATVVSDTPTYNNQQQPRDKTK